MISNGFVPAKDWKNENSEYLRKNVEDSPSLQPNNKKPSAAIIYNLIQLTKGQLFVVTR